MHDDDDDAEAEEEARDASAGTAPRGIPAASHARADEYAGERVDGPAGSLGTVRTRRRFVRAYDANARAPTSATPLTQAIDAGMFSVVHILLRHSRADPKATNDNNKNAADVVPSGAGGKVITQALFRAGVHPTGSMRYGGSAGINPRNHLPGNVGGRCPAAGEATSPG